MIAIKIMLILLLSICLSVTRAQPEENFVEEALK